MAEIFFADPVTLTEELRAVTDLQVGDLDGDGDLDVAAAPSFHTEFAWLENTGGSPTAFITHRVPLPEGLRSPWAVEVADVDGDGDLDVLTSHLREGDETVWHENLGGNPLSWTSHVIHRFDSIPDDTWGSRSLAAADFDGDGDIDVVSTHDHEDVLHWHENLAGDGSQWLTHVLDHVNGAWGVSTADLDRDGDADILVAARDTGFVHWYENTDAAFVRRDIGRTVDQARTAMAADMDGDGDLDVVSSSTNPWGYDIEWLQWHRNDGGSPPHWTTLGIPTAPNFTIEALPVDLDGDGDVDILSNSLSEDHAALCWVESDGGSPPGFTEHCRPNAESPEPVRWAVPGDFNGDGVQDVIASLHRSDPAFNRIVLFEGVTSGDAYEWDDWVTHATPILPGDVQEHSIHLLGDQDWTVFSLTEPAMISGAISGASSEILLYLLTLDEEGWHLLDIEGGRNPALEAHLMPDIYYLVAEEWGNDALVPHYQLSLNTAPHTGDPYEIDNWAQVATPLTLGVWSQGHSINPVTDQDWFVFTLPRRTEVNVRANSDGPDIALYLLHHSPMGWGLVGFDGDEHAKMRFTLPAGTHHVVVEDLHRNGVVRRFSVRVSD